MKRHIIFEKSTILANKLLETGLCKNEGKWIFSCNDDIKDMKKLQDACNKIVKRSIYPNYKLTFALENDYSNIITV